MVNGLVAWLLPGQRYGVVTASQLPVPRGSGRGGDQFGDVGMQCDESAVEGRKPAAVGSRQLGEVAVGHLPVADDALEFEIGE